MACNSSEKPYIFMPQTWGPFQDRETRRSVKEMLTFNNVTTYARDIESQKHVADLLELDAKHILISHDIAFCFGTPIDHFATDGDDYSVVMPSRKLFQLLQNKGYRLAEEYIGLLVAACLTASEKGPVFVLPHEVCLKEGAIDDVAICHAVIGACKSDRIHSISSIPDLDDAAGLKKIISGATAVFSSRFHGIVASLSTGVSCVAVGWSHKYEELISPFSPHAVAYCLDGLNHEEIRSTGELAIESFANSIDSKRSYQTAMMKKAIENRKSVSEVFDNIATNLQKPT